VLLLLMLLLTRTACAGGLEARWLSAAAGAEITRYADEDPYMFQGAEGRTRSLYGSAGTGTRWLVAAGFSDQRITQDSWRFHGLKRSLWVVGAPSPSWGVEVMGVSTSTGMKWPTAGATSTDHESGWTLGTGLNWCPQLDVAAPVLLNVRVYKTRAADLATQETAFKSGELNLQRRSAGGSQRIGLLASRVESDNKAAVLLRSTWSRGRLDAHASVLTGHLDNWFDVEKLVLHDGALELKSLASAGVGWSCWKGLSLEASAGWEKVSGSESRWLFLAARWTQKWWVAGR
jgi:hypothetical protein